MELWICRFETHIHQTAVGNPLHAEVAQERGELRGGSLVRKIAAGDGFGKAARPGEFRTQGKPIVADSLQREGLAGQDFCLRLNVIVRIHHVVVGIRPLKGKNIGIFPVDFNARRGHVDGLHAEGGDADDSNHREHEGQDEPLVLPKNEQIIVEVRLAGRQIEGSKTARDRRHQLHGAV